MKRLLPIFLIVCMLLCACNQTPAEQTTEPSQAEPTTIVTTEPTTVPSTDEATVPATSEATEPPVVITYNNPLNGTPVDAPYTARPYAIVINNYIYAQPMCSLNSADFVFEILAEGGITRCLAVYSDIAGLNHIGAIRSTRPYILQLACSFYAIFIHHCGSADGYDKIYELDVDYLDALRGAGAAYYRDQNRLNSGYSLEHTSFADGDDLLDMVADYEYPTTREEGLDYGFTFAETSSAVAGNSAPEVTVTFGSCGKTTKLSYDETTGLYTARQYGDRVIDGNTDELVTYRNVLMITADTYDYERNEVARVHIELLGEGTGYFACDGKVVPIKWSRATDYDPFVFTHEDGTPITFGTGNTYVAVTPLNGTLEY